MEWSLKPDIFKVLKEMVGSIDIDLFASRLNNKTEKYVSYNPDPHAVAIDPFSINWTNHCYIFPPFSVIGRVLQKIIKDRVGKVVLIAPI